MTTLPITFEAKAGRFNPGSVIFNTVFDLGANVTDEQLRAIKSSICVSCNVPQDLYPEVHATIAKIFELISYKTVESRPVYLSYYDGIPNIFVKVSICFRSNDFYTQFLQQFKKSFS